MTPRLALVVVIALAGFGLTVWGAFLILPPLAPLLAGLALLWLAFTMEV